MKYFVNVLGLEKACSCFHMETVSTVTPPLPEDTHAHSWHILLITKVKEKIPAAISIANLFWFMSCCTQVNTDKLCVRFSYLGLAL